MLCWYNRPIMKKWIFISLIIIQSVLLTACSPEELVIQDAVETPALIEYETPTPTLEIDAPTPEIEPTLPPTPTPTPFMYSVAAGDTMGVIAYTYNLILDQLIAANPGIDPRFLSIGAQLVIPFGEAGSINLPTPVAVEFDSLEPKCYISILKEAWCFWLIENNTDAVYENISARFRLYDQNGVEITNQLGMIPINRLKTGDRMPVIAYFPPIVPEWSLVQVQIESLLQSPEGSERFLSVELVDSRVEMGEDNLYADFFGSIRLGNTDITANLIWAAVTAYDDNGDVVGSRRWEADQILEPGTVMDFNITIYSISRPIDHIEIILEARP
jgi:hypothetical protein